jgi:hypothetical protein
VRKIIRVDMDAFHASVEQRDKPQLRGKPVIVAWQSKRSVACGFWEIRARARFCFSTLPRSRLLDNLHDFGFSAYRQFSTSMSSLENSSVWLKSSHLPSVDTDSPPIQPRAGGLSITYTRVTLRVSRSIKSISALSDSPVTK